MQGYYNIPYMASGGTLFSLAGSTSKYLEKLLGSEKGIKSLKGLSLSLSKKNPTLSSGIKNLLDKKLDAKGIEDLQKLAKQHLVTTSGYQSRLKNMQNALRYRKQALDLLKKAEESENKVVQKASTQEAAVENATKNTTENATKQTLGSMWTSTKNWFNEHPKTVLLTSALGLGTGPGRWLLGNGLKATQSSPGSWFGDDSTTSLNSGSSDFIMINGTKIPIKRSPEGYFIPVDETSSQQGDAMSGDSVDQALAGVTNENIGVDQDNQQYDQQVPQISQQDINDLFSDDQW